MPERAARWLLIFFAAYLLLLGGSPYYFTIYPVRVLHHVLMTFVLAGWLGYRLLRRRGLPYTRLSPLILAAVGVWAVTALFSRDPRISLEALWFPLTHLLLFLGMVSLIQSGQTRLLMEALFLITVLIVFIAFVQLGSWWFGWGVVPGTEVGWGPLLAGGILPSESPGLFLPLGVTTWLAAFAAPMAVFSAGWAFAQRQRVNRIGFLVLAGLLVLIVWLTGARGGLVSLAVGGAALALLLFVRSERYHLLNRRQKIAFVALPAAAVALVGAVVITISQLPRSGSSDQLRLGLWRGALTIFSGDPLLGAGPGMFGRAYREARTDWYVDDRLGTAHNAILNTLAETGLAGIVVLISLAGAAAWIGWRSWRAAQGAQASRLAAAGAALAGFAVHSQFDLFTATPNVLLMFFLIALLVVDPAGLPPVRRRDRAAAAVALIIVVLYGAAFAVWDTAQAAFNRSLSPDVPVEQALEFAQAAHERDPALHLYELQIAYLTTRAAERDASLSGDAERLLGRALELEPTWDTGLMLLADLRERAGRYEDALALLERAHAVNGRNAAEFNWARLAEQYRLADDDVITAAYDSAIRTALRHLPLSSFWWQTDVRRAALEAYATDAHAGVQLRLWRVHDPSRIAGLLSALPDDPYGEWVRGETALTNGDADAAIAHFQTARRSGYAPIGDIYASLARALYAQDPAAPEVRLYLDAAAAAGTQLEMPNVLRAELAETEAQAFQLRVQALPPRVIEQNFEGVLYLGRTASFELPLSMRLPGPGRAVMDPWYRIAQDYERAGNPGAAANVYRAILAYAPDETDALSALERLGESAS
jgi:tetratricopeptide (TPR) repeat protein/O-antigen ligase